MLYSDKLVIILKTNGNGTSERPYRISAWNGNGWSYQGGDDDGWYDRMTFVRSDPIDYVYQKPCEKKMIKLSRCLEVDATLEIFDTLHQKSISKIINL